MKNHHLFQIDVKIKLEKEVGRTWSIKTGYRPAFNFIKETLTSGSITLLERDELYPGEEALVKINFHSLEPLGNIREGTSFNFYEGALLIGSGKVLNIIGWIKT